MYWISREGAHPWERLTLPHQSLVTCFVRGSDPTKFPTFCLSVSIDTATGQILFRQPFLGDPGSLQTSWASGSPKLSAPLLRCSPSLGCKNCAVGGPIESGFLTAITRVMIGVLEFIN